MFLHTVICIIYNILYKTRKVFIFLIFSVNLMSKACQNEMKGQKHVRMKLKRIFTYCTILSSFTKL